MRVGSIADPVAWANGRKLPDPDAATQEFEALLIGEFMKQAQQGQRWSKLFGEGATNAMTQSMWMDEVVSRAVAARGLGLAADLGAPAGAGEER